MKTVLYNKKGEIVHCLLCNHYCRISPGKTGICRVRKNENGDLRVLNAGRLVARSIDPIEKKPIFHLMPGTSSYSIAGAGCNFQCTFCQNAHIAQVSKDDPVADVGIATTGEQIVQQALASGCKSISYTYTEPTVFFEIALETARLAKQEGLHNIFVTNGFMSREALDLLLPHLSAANVDLKAFDDRFYRKYCKAALEPVKKSIEIMNAHGILVELTTLLIPGLNDQEDVLAGMADYICGTLGPQTPWHISRFHPCHRMTDRGPTPAQSLEAAYHIGKAAGLHHVYIGNLPGSEYENTSCHKCGHVLIERSGYRTRVLMKDGGICPSCGTKLWGIF